MVNTILKFIRKGNIRSVHSISDGKVEVIELTTKESSRVVGKKINEIKFPHHSLIIYATRGKQNIIPDGKFVIQKGDHIILISRKEAIEKIEEMFTR
ncbi:Trk system potassium uptake protein TrkA [subsurface metagenome]